MRAARASATARPRAHAHTMHTHARTRAENKISKDNAWDLRIIDYMPALIEAMAEEECFNFQKTSVALHASAQVG